MDSTNPTERIKVYANREDADLTIEIDSILHLAIMAHGHISVQSWIRAGALPSTSSMYCIEYYFDGREILTEYESREMWVHILDRLRHVLNI